MTRRAHDAAPARPPQPACAAPGDAARPVARRCPVARRILVAEDNPTNRLVLEALLADAVGEIVATGDGREAVEAFEPGAFDAVLLDIAMPVMDGLEALGRIRRAEREAGLAPTAVIAVTANVMPEQVEAYLAAGFDDVVAKPVSEARLTGAIAGAAERAAAGRAAPLRHACIAPPDPS